MWIVLLLLWIVPVFGEEYNIVVNTTDEYEALLNEWYLVQECKREFEAERSVPEGMEAKLDKNGDIACTGTPTQQAKQVFLQKNHDLVALQGEYKIWGRAEISQILQKNPELDIRKNPAVTEDYRETYEHKTKAERDAVKALAPKKE